MAGGLNIVLSIMMTALSDEGSAEAVLLTVRVDKNNSMIYCVNGNVFVVDASS
jgi:hypothetical protein